MVIDKWSSPGEYTSNLSSQINSQSVPDTSQNKDGGRDVEDSGSRAVKQSEGVEECAGTSAIVSAEAEPEEKVDIQTLAASINNNLLLLQSLIKENQAASGENGGQGEGQEEMIQPAQIEQILALIHTE